MADEGTLERIYVELRRATESVEVLREALSPDDFAHLKSEAAKRLQKVDDALSAVGADLEKKAPQAVATIRARHGDLQAELDRAVFEGEPPPDVMTVTGEYER
mgnify:CR=1 FL=1